MGENRKRYWYNFLSLLVTAVVLLIPARAAGTAGSRADVGGPEIHMVTTNTGDYPRGQIPRFEKLEISFRVGTAAENLYLPYDPTPPEGVQAAAGISVEALFTPDNWQTVYRQPAFLYQDFEDQVKRSEEWFYPTGTFQWKVRFAPNQTGVWQFKLAAEDASGHMETPAQMFTVADSENRGFVRVSRRDPRYFEFDNGSYFPGISYNMNYDDLDWNNPVLDNREDFQRMGENGIQLVRVWLSQWGIYGSSWNPWNSIVPEQHGQYIPYNGITLEDAAPGSEASMRIQADYNPCMFTGFMKAPPAVKRNTTYRVRVKLKTDGVTGPRQAGKPYGFVVKTGGWLWGDGQNCNDPGTGTLATKHLPSTNGWEVLEGRLKTGDRDFLPNLYLALENATAGYVDVDRVWIEEDLGDGAYGPNILPKPWMSHHLYMDQRNSYAFDKLLDLAAENDVYLRLVLMEKNEVIFNHINFNGQPVPDNRACRDETPANDPPECPGNKWFYGDGRNMTRGRWLQQAWWRYVQARWGYSTQVHSWELLNEGDPYDGNHYQLADEFGRYMHQFAPNQHMVSTSFWHSFPKPEFWANSKYPNIDFADVHRYVEADDRHYLDAAQETISTSLEFGALQPGGAGKPVIRGEVGFLQDGGQAAGAFKADSEGTWLHNFIWAGLNAGGLIESYWYEDEHIYRRSRDGGYLFDHRPLYRSFSNFVTDLPLNNGHYIDAAASVDNSELRVVGQKDLANGRAHLWIQNQEHTWEHVFAKMKITGASGSIRIGGFPAGEGYTVEWWDTYQPDLSRQILDTGDGRVNERGEIVLQVGELTRDVAVRVWLDSAARLPGGPPCFPGGDCPEADGRFLDLLAAW